MIYHWFVHFERRHTRDTLDRDGVSLVSKAMWPTKGTVSNQIPSSMLICRVHLFRHGISLVGAIFKGDPTDDIIIIAVRVRLHKV